MRRLAPVLALLASMLLAAPASACTYPMEYEGPFDCDITPRPRGTTTTTTVAPTTTTAPDVATEDTEPAEPSEGTAPDVTVAGTGGELPFTGGSTTVTLAAAVVFMATGALVFFVARTKPKH